MIYNSWEIMNDFVAIKKSDLSFFAHKGSGIPKDTRDFWGVQGLTKGEKQNIKIFYQNKDYRAYIRLASGQTRIFWRTDLHKIILSSFPNHKEFTKENYPLFKFTKINPDEYEIEFSMEITDVDEENYESYDDVSSGKEGKQKVYYVTRYERNPVNRRKAIEIHGTKCKVCGFDFGEVYGEIGNGLVEVHHIVPLHDKKEEIIVNPQTDLVPVCANCHRIIHHTRYKTYTIEEVKNMIQKTTNYQ